MIGYDLVMYFTSGMLLAFFVVSAIIIYMEK
jgi:hypothetical protein